MLGTAHDKANKEDMHAWMSHTHEHVRRLVDEHSKLTYLHLQNHACMPSNQEYKKVYQARGLAHTFYPGSYYGPGQKIFFYFNLIYYSNEF